MMMMLSFVVTGPISILHKDQENFYLTDDGSPKLQFVAPKIW